MKSKLLMIILGLFTLIIFAVTAYAGQQLGWNEGMVFITDFAHPWRAQFNTDFSLHILLLMGWVFWRETNIASRILCTLGCLMGGLFTFPYLLVSLYRCRGDVRRLMLGRHA